MNTQLGSRNRKAGHKFEIIVRDWFKAIGYSHLVTCRSESRSRDDQKVDLINKDESKNGRFPYNVQCKNVSSHLKYKQILGEIRPARGIVNVIFHKLTTRVCKSGTRGTFVHQGTYAILAAEDFIRMAEKLKKLEALVEIPTFTRQTPPTDEKPY